MSALTLEFDSHIHGYRRQTERQAAMPGVTGPSFVCGGCKLPRLVIGRKQTALGYRCAECMARRAARRASQTAEKEAA